MTHVLAKLRPGSPRPLGASFHADGVNFAIKSSHADAVTLCLINENGEETRYELDQRDGDIWHGFLPGVRASQRYGYRIAGPVDPSQGMRFDSEVLLLDPYARATAGPNNQGSFTGLIMEEDFDWEGDQRPGIPLDELVIYEMHVKGFTQRHPGVAPQKRGTYAGLADPASIAYLQQLGVNAVELLPVQQNLSEPFLSQEGLTNYWGYNTVGFFAPHDRYSSAVASGRSGGQVDEFKSMVAALHAAGIAVILDVVFNHTAEGDEAGPTLMFRGIDNLGYYRTDPTDRAVYVDLTGCGNSIDTADPATLQLILDSLRYWFTHMRVDGFRFDLAVELARTDADFSQRSPFLSAIGQDPILSAAILIAEPWDVGGADSYQVGQFPAPWSEWNGQFRDCVRDFWRGTPGIHAQLASRMTGSVDIYGDAHRRPTASINFITAHDGFTLADLVSYETKQNEANLQHNQDGSDDNRSWNCGVEGASADESVIALRAQQQRSFLATLLLSSGIPMLTAGDELGRTQNGNNNGYCQDNETSWLDWSSADRELLEFTRSLLRIRRDHPVFRRQQFIPPTLANADRWLRPDGEYMNDADWADDQARSLAVLLRGDFDPDVDAAGAMQSDDDFLMVLNAWSQSLAYSLPISPSLAPWHLELSSAAIAAQINELTGHFLAPAHSFSLFRRANWSDTSGILGQKPLGSNHA